MKREHGIPPVPRGAPAEHEEHSLFRNYIRDLVLGFNDGVVSVFAVVAGLVGSGLFLADQIAVAGLAALTAGALSMGIGEYISTKAQAEYYEAERARERRHIEQYPEIEARELREYMAGRGFEGDLLDRVVETLTVDKERFLEAMMREEFGMGEEIQRSPIRSMLFVMAAFVAGAALAVAPFLVVAPQAAVAGLAVAAVLSIGGLATAGVARAVVSGISVPRSAFEMTLLGAAAALVTYGIGSVVGVAI